MGHSNNITDSLSEALIGKEPSHSSVLLSFMDHPRKKAADRKRDLRCHRGFIDDTLLNGPCGAKVIDLDEYRWMKMFDEL